MTTDNGVPLLRVSDLCVHFRTRARLLGGHAHPLKAVDGVSLDLPGGKTLGLVGESGCGKSTLARAILRLIPATSGRVYFDGHDLFTLPLRALRPLRRRMQFVFQDPYGSLNPRLRVETIVGEALTVHGLVRTNAERRARVAQLLAQVGLTSADGDRFPHEFSGGQRQRIGIARALALQPSLIICDEPVSALDVSIQAQILNLLADLKQQLGLTYLFIAHNLAVVRHICAEVAVMYLGRIVEHAPTAQFFAHPGHPYTRALLAAATTFEPGLSGEPPSPLNPPPGCPFHPRCPLAQPRCHTDVPQLTLRAGLSPAQRVACHFAGE
jgi:oligopeptide/dipeptide ABC transporter ATP-binding protein